MRLSVASLVLGWMLSVWLPVPQAAGSLVSRGFAAVASGLHSVAGSARTGAAGPGR